MDQIILKDLPVFKHKLAAAAINFRWPKLEDLEALQLKEPLKLTAIRAKGVERGVMTAIQLIFQNGI